MSTHNICMSGAANARNGAANACDAPGDVCMSGVANTHDAHGSAHANRATNICNARMNGARILMATLAQLGLCVRAHTYTLASQ